MTASTITRTDKAHSIEPLLPSIRTETQLFQVVRRNSLALDSASSAINIIHLNQVLADTMTLRDMYKKHHWQASGPTFYMVHLLFDKHYIAQAELVDLLAERVQTLGGLAIAMAADVAEATLIPRIPKGREDTVTQFNRLLEAHEIILKEARAMARESEENGDDGTNDILVSDVIRTNELQVWFIAEHLQ